VKLFELDQMLGTIKVQQRPGIGGLKVGALERGEKAAGAALVLLKDGPELGGSGWRIEAAERLGLIVKGVKKAGGVFFTIVMIDESLQVFFFQEREVAGDDEPIGIGIMLEGGLETT
jgi:hypothetical protein